MHSWTGNLFSTPQALAANFGPCLEAAAEGRSAGQGVCFSASRRQLRVWPGRGGGGVRRWTGSLLSTLLGANFGPAPEGAAEGRPTKRGASFSSSLGVVHCFGPVTMAKGHMDKEFASLRFSPPSSGRWRPSWKDCCYGWLWRVLLAIPTMLCSVAVSGVMLPTVPGLDMKKKPGMERGNSRRPEDIACASHFCLPMLPQESTVQL